MENIKAWTGKDAFSFCLIGFIVILLLAAYCLQVRAQISAKYSTKIKTSFQLSRGRLEINYAGQRQELTINYVLNKERKEYTLALSSQQKLGLLVIADETEISYSVSFLLTDEDWKPLDDLNSKKYEVRGRLNHRPGWRILVIEKITRFSI